MMRVMMVVGFVRALRAIVADVLDHRLLYSGIVIVRVSVRSANDSRMSGDVDLLSHRILIIVVHRNMNVTMSPWNNAVSLWSAARPPVTTAIPTWRSTMHNSPDIMNNRIEIYPIARRS